MFGLLSSAESLPEARMRPLSALGLALNLALAGCAAAMPGYVPPSAKADKMKAAAPKGGGFDESGSYSLTDQEQKLDCKHMTGGVTIKILQMREAGERAKPSAPAKVAQDAMKKIKGSSSYGADTDADYKRDRARLETMNKQLAEKNCRTFDLEAELAAGNAAMPMPIGEAKANGQKK